MTHCLMVQVAVSVEQIKKPAYITDSMHMQIKYVVC